MSRLHARLSFDGARWGITDLESKNGIRCDGARRLAFPLAPGVEVGIGGITLLADSPQLIALRGVLARLIGWSPARAGDVDLALREVRLAATRRESLVLCGDGDLVSVARLLHRHALGDARPFVVCDPRRRATDSSARAAANYGTGVEALTAALGGTLCVWRGPARAARMTAGAIRGSGWTSRRGFRSPEVRGAAPGAGSAQLADDRARPGAVEQILGAALVDVAE